MLTLLAISFDGVKAAAGGGSSGYGGGGGGGGGFSGGGGYSGGGEIGTGGVAVILVIVGLVVLAMLVGAYTAWRLRRRRAARVQRVVQASFEAAQDDAYLAADAVVADAAAFFRTVQRLWSANDVAGLAPLVGPDLMVEWERRLRDFAAKDWHNVVEVRSDPRIEYVGLVNRTDDHEDQVVVRVSATLLDYVRDGHGRQILKTGETTTETALAEYWTLERRGDGWMLVSIESDTEGVHHLDAPIVPSPWSDDAALRDEALVEGAVADKTLPGFATADLVDVSLSDDARAQALDLSIVDGRFAPDVLEVAARRAVGAWVEAVDGADHDLLALAEPQAAATLLHGTDGSGRTRVVLRGARVERIAIDALEAGTEAEPARMTVTVGVRARRYVEDRDTAAVVSGSKDVEVTFVERWTFALRDDDAHPWRMVEATEPVAG